MTTKNKIMEWEGNKYHHYILSISIRGKKNAEQLDKKESERWQHKILKNAIYYKFSRSELKFCFPFV